MANGGPFVTTTGQAMTLASCAECWAIARESTHPRCPQGGVQKVVGTASLVLIGLALGWCAKVSATKREVINLQYFMLVCRRSLLQETSH